jgi:hypothetical protein
MARKFIKNFLIYFFGTLAFLIISLTLAFGLINIIAHDLIKASYGDNITLTLEQLALNISNHRYIENKYDCSEFSRDLVKQLRGNNISAYCVNGFYKESYLDFDPHTWIEANINGTIIPVEATFGEVIDKANYSEHYIILSKGYCF